MASIDRADLNVKPTISLLLRPTPAVNHREKSVAVLERFISDEKLYSAAIVDDALIPVGLIDRGRLIETFVRPFAKDLHHKKAISEFMDTKPVIVDRHTDIDDMARIIIDAGMRHMVSGFIIVENGVYAGMGTGHDLLQEITDRKQRHLYFLAHYDQLTGLPNRLLFHDRLQQACQSARRNNTSVGLIFIDLDRFKYINDTLGHTIGDLLLRSVGERLSEYVRDCDTVARLGGDEFVIILQNIKEMEDTTRISEIILEGFKKPLHIDTRELQVSASLGIALFPQHDPTPEGLIRKADAAMYEAKHRGRNNFLHYVEAFSHAMLERMSLETQLKTALEKDELSLFYQPQFDLGTGHVVGVEALLRWCHPELGSVSPARFIPIAEETGLIIPIGSWVLQEACRQHRAWIADGLPPLRIAVNISALQLRQPEFCDVIRTLIAEMDIDPQYLELEMTEGMVMKDAELTVVSLSELRKLGIKLAIDDFGTGYSSLSYLRKFPIDRIKIDRSFIASIQSITANQAIVQAIIALGKSLNLELIAEGVETPEELACISAFDCQEAQGYYFSRPIPAMDFQAWYRQLNQCQQSRPRE